MPRKYVVKKKVKPRKGRKGQKGKTKKKGNRKKTGKALWRKKMFAIKNKLIM